MVHSVPDGKRAGDVEKDEAENDAFATKKDGLRTQFDVHASGSIRQRMLD